MVKYTMLVHVRCITCGYPIGELEDLFRYMKTEQIRKKLRESRTSIAFALIDPGLQTECGGILDALGVTCECCRTCLMTGLRFEDVY